VLGSLVPVARGRWPFDPSTGQLESLRAVAVFCGVLLIGVAGATIDVPFVRRRLGTISLISIGALGLPLVSTLALALRADPRLRGPSADAWTFALFAGLALSVSAIPVIVKILADLGLLHRDLSLLSLSVAVIDDATVWVGLSLVAAVVHLEQGTGSGGLRDRLPLALGALVALVALVAVVAVTRRGSAPTDPPSEPDRAEVGRAGLLAATVITLGAVVTGGLGLDSTLGAFACGAMLASGRLVPVSALQPLRSVVLGVLAPLFLAVNGLSADLTALRDPRLALVAVGAVVLAVVSKSVGAYGGGRLAGLSHPASVAVSSALNARGTVQLVVATAGLQLGLIGTEGFTILVLVALVTSAMAGPLVRRAMRRLPESPGEGRRRSAG
jgi:Kef-type K+ transport system membrane component KefB